MRNLKKKKKNKQNKTITSSQRNQISSNQRGSGLGISGMGEWGQLHSD